MAEGLAGVMLKSIIVLLVAGLLTGCTHWHKDGATRDDFDAADESCLSSAYHQAPQNCTGGPLENADCNDTGNDYVPSDLQQMDTSVKARENAYETCMSSKGWSKLESKGAMPSIFNLPR